MDENQFDTLIKKLDSITNLLAFSLVKDKSVNEQIETLTKSGLKVSEIASILDKTENQVYVTQTNLRKKKKPIKESQEEQIEKKSTDIASNFEETKDIKKIEGNENIEQ